MLRRRPLASTRRGIDPARTARERGEVFYPSFSRRLGGAPDRHTREAFRLMDTLRHAFDDRADLKVSGLVRVYYDASHPRRWVEPDVFVAVGASREEVRGYYKLWLGCPRPDFVIEIAYDETHREDQFVKPTVYAQLGVRELVYYDPVGDYLAPPLQIYTLDGGQYRPVEPIARDTYESRVLDLQLALVDGRLQLFDRATGERVVQSASDSDR